MAQHLKKPLVLNISRLGVRFSLFVSSISLSLLGSLHLPPLPTKPHQKDCICLFLALTWHISPCSNGRSKKDGKYGVTILSGKHMRSFSRFITVELWRSYEELSTKGHRKLTVLLSVTHCVVQKITSGNPSILNILIFWEFIFWEL